MDRRASAGGAVDTGRDDVAGFIAGFAGDDRYIVDYLVEEVLQRQSDHVRHFLLQTSIMDRLSGPLCDAVTGRDGGKAMLEALDRGNLFLVPLDDRRQWYRYHQLFADVLQAHLLEERAEDVPELHRRASAWYEQNGEPAEAIRHALAAEDFERAADLIELAAPATRQYRQEVTLRRWLEALPEELFMVRPVLSNAYAGSLLVRGEVEGVESHLQDAEPWLDPRTGGPPGSLARSPEMVVVDEEGFRVLPARSLSTAPGKPGSSATRPAPLPTPGGHSTSSARTTTSGVEGQLHSSDSCTGRMGISMRPTIGMPMAWPVWRRPGTSLT